MDLEYMNQGGMNQFTPDFFLVNRVEHQNELNLPRKWGCFDSFLVVNTAFVGHRH